MYLRSIMKVSIRTMAPYGRKSIDIFFYIENVEYSIAKARSSEDNRYLLKS